MNYVFSPNEGVNSHLLERGGISSNHNTLSKTSFEAIFKALVTQSQYINAIHKLGELKQIEQH